MANPAEKPHEDEDFEQPTLDQIRSIKAGNDNANSIIGINDTRSKIGQMLAVAKNDGRISEMDKARLEAKLYDKKTETDEGEVFRIGNEVKQIMAERQQLINKFSTGIQAAKDEQGREVLNIQAEVEKFMALPVAEQKKYEAKLLNNIDFVKGLFKVVAERTPEQIEAFKNMDGSAKKKLAKEIEKKYQSNVKKYEDLIDKHADLFSKKSKEDWIRDFNEKSIKEQERYLREFENEIADKKELADKFKKYPAKLKTGAESEESFKEARKNRRLIILQNLDNKMWDAAKSILNNSPDAKYFSEKDRREVEKNYKDKDIPIEVRNLMLATLPEHMKKTAEIAKKYEKMEDTTKLSVQAEQGFTDFYQLSFEEKTKAIDRGEEIDKLTVQLKKTYEGKLKESVSKGYMAEKSMKTFMEDWEELTFARKNEWVDKFESDEGTKREKITEEFNALKAALSPADKEKHKDFYNLGYRERMSRMNELREKYKPDATKEALAAKEKAPEATTLEGQIKVMKTTAGFLEAQHKFEAAGKMYEGILLLNPQDKEAQERLNLIRTGKAAATPITAAKSEEIDLTDTEINEALSTSKNTEAIKRAREELEVEELITEAVYRSDEIHHVYEAARKTRGLDSKQREIDEALRKETGGTMKINDKTGEAIEIEKWEMGKVDKVKSEGRWQQWKEQAKVMQADRTKIAQFGDDIQLKNEDNSRNVTGQEAREQIKAKKAALQKQVAQLAKNRITSQKGGKKLSEGSDKKLTDLSRKQNLEVRLNE